MKWRLCMWWLVVTAMQVLVVAAGVWFWLDRHNTLSTQNGVWEVSKQNLGLSVMGSQDFYVQRQALAGGKLNLGAWHGFQQVRYTIPIDYNSLQITFDIDQGGYIYFLFSCQDHYCDALRLSNSSHLRSSLVRISPEGEFISQQTVPVTVLKQKNNHLTLALSSDRNELLVQLNEVYLYHLDIEVQSEPRIIGFRNGWLPVKIDEIRAKDWSGETILLETFDNQKTWKQLFTKTVLITVAITLLVLSFGTGFLQLDPQQIAKKMFLLFFMIFICGLSVAVVDHYLTPRYPDVYSWFSNWGKKEQVFVESESMKIVDQLRGKYTLKPKANIFRVMCLGSSQAWGAGVLHPEDAFVTQLELIANKKLGNRFRKFEFIPAAVSGIDSVELVSLYESEWRLFKPKLLLVNYSTNDFSSAGLAVQLERLLTITEKDGVEVILVLEANSIEYRSVVENHQVMKEIAKKHNLKVIDMHSHLATQYDQGILWWDFVHPTSFGHRLIAEYLYSQIQQELRSP